MVAGGYGRSRTISCEYEDVPVLDRHAHKGGVVWRLKAIVRFPRLRVARAPQLKGSVECAQLLWRAEGHVVAAPGLAAPGLRAVCVKSALEPSALVRLRIRPAGVT